MKPQYNCSCKKGAVEHAAYTVTGRPEFYCNHCKRFWTDGDDGGEWKKLVAKIKWFAEYKCGCVSSYFRYKRSVLDYCGTHGDNVRYYHKIKE